MDKIQMNLKISTNDLKEYSNELFNQIQNDSFYPKLKEEGWTDLEIHKNVTKFKEYLDDMHKSEGILSYEDCIKNNMTSRLILVRHGNVIERSFEPLKPYKDHVEYINHFFYADFGDLPTNANINKVDKRVKNAVGKKVKTNNWIYLFGVPRSGRSYAALALLNWYYNQNKGHDKTFAYIDSVIRIKELNDLYFKNREDFNELIDAYSKIDYLVIDNFGSEYKNELIRDSIIYPILLNRFTKQKMTIVTSDFTLLEVEQLYTFKKSNSDIITSKLFALLKSKFAGDINCGNLPIY